MTRGSVRREVRIARSPADIWELVGDPARVHEWFPGIESCTVSVPSTAVPSPSRSTAAGPMTRIIVTGAGLPMPEEIVTLDPIQRRFQYRITSPLFREHLSTLDVLDVGDGTSLVVYGCDAAPSTMALIIAGAAGNALHNLRRMMEL